MACSFTSYLLTYSLGLSVASLPLLAKPLDEDILKWDIELGPRHGPFYLVLMRLSTSNLHL